MKRNTDSKTILKTTQIISHGAIFTVYAEGEKRGVITTPVTNLQYARVTGESDPQPNDADIIRKFTADEFRHFIAVLDGCCTYDDPPHRTIVRTIKEGTPINYDGSYHGFMQAELYDGGAKHEVKTRKVTEFIIIDGFSLTLKFNLNHPEVKPFKSYDLGCFIIFIVTILTIILLNNC